VSLGAKRRLAKRNCRRQHQNRDAPIYLVFTIGWNLPSPQLAPRIRSGEL
jgi:hypothetical protein